MVSHPNFPEEPLLETQEEGFGYYPARPGDLVSRDRYKIIGKLGWGKHSSTWVVANVEYASLFDSF
jgi:serine/threonine-protein kinase SRPK3